jgi:hypothetical protein
VTEVREVPVDFTRRAPVNGASAKANGATHTTAAQPTESLPEIQITHELHRNVDAMIGALRADLNLYQRSDSRLVHVTRITREESDASAPTNVGAASTPRRALVEGSPQIRELAQATLRERCTRVALCLRYRKGRRKDDSDGGWFAALPSDPILSAILARGQWPGIPVVRGVVEAPTMRPDGSIVQTPGYDRATGYVYLPSEPFPEIPDAPSVADAAKSLAALDEIFVDFPYRNAAHRSVPVAAILTILGRPAIAGAVPAFLFDAPTRGSGKTLATDAIAIVTTGRVAPRMNYPVKVYVTSHGQSVSVNDEELEKILASYARRGAALISLDNVTAAFGGAPLDRVLTARGSVEIRLLGTNDVPEYPWTAAILATGNNMELLLDTVRRVLMCRLEPALENPEARTEFKHGDLIGWLRAERPRLVVAALTVLRAYVVAKRPDMKCDRWGSFEEWSALIPPAIVYAGGADPMGARVGKETPRDDATATLACIVTELPRVNAGQLGLDSAAVRAFTAKELRAALYPDREGEGPRADPYPDLRQAVESLVVTKRGGQPSAQAIGNALAKLRGRVVSIAVGDGTELRRLAVDFDTHTKVSRYRSESVEPEARP